MCIQLLCAVYRLVMPENYTLNCAPHFKNSFRAAAIEPDDGTGGKDGHGRRVIYVTKSFTHTHTPNTLSIFFEMEKNRRKKNKIKDFPGESVDSSRVRVSYTVLLYTYSTTVRSRFSAPPGPGSVLTRSSPAVSLSAKMFTVKVFLFSRVITI